MPHQRYTKDATEQSLKCGHTMGPRSEVDRSTLIDTLLNRRRHLGVMIDLCRWIVPEKPDTLPENLLLQNPSLKAPSQPMSHIPSGI